MEDKKVLEFINENHEKSYENHVQSQIRRKKKDTIQCITLILTILTAVLVLGSVIQQETKKSVRECVKLGNTINYCTMEARK